ncbi:MAG TPA: Rab family GTPase [Candidatus Lokiarchaeia archaeon]|nr:Rab family GTPase [Candidatus Lokiarchaeia archaeon]
MLEAPPNNQPAVTTNFDSTNPAPEDFKTISTDCKICNKSIECQVPIKKREHYPFSFVFYHGRPVHAIIIYIDANYAVRGSEIIKEIGGQVRGPSGVLAKKCVVAGDWGVGKTSLIQRIAYDQFQDSYDPSITIGIQECEFALSEDLSMKIQFWEVTGQHSSANIQLRKKSFAGADLALVLCDVTRQSTFDYLNELVDDINTFAGRQCAIFAIANKIDQADARQVSPEGVLEYQRKLNVPFFEVSLKERLNLDDSLARWLCELQKKDVGGSCST